MVKTKKLIIFFMLLSCFFILLSTVSAADFRVKEKTSHDDITNWMKTAKSGDSLIFTSSNYNLTDMVIIDKDITVKSNKNTKIAYNKNKTMFYIIANRVTFSSLTLNHNGQGSNESKFAVVSAAKDTAKRINFNKVTINAKKSYVSGIDIPLWNGSVSNSRINIKGIWGHGVSSEQWNGNVAKSYVTTSGKSSVSLSSVYWSGKVSGSRIYNTAPYDVGGVPSGIIFVYGKGTISKSIIRVPNGNALRLDKNIKVTGCSLQSRKGHPKHYKFLPDLSINSKDIKRSKTTYSVKVTNNYYGSSNACYLGIKIGSYVKTTKVKALAFGQSTNVKVTLPSKYINKKYTKNVKVDYYNKIKEQTKDNNIFKFN
ncbi:MAG: hypothetical protein FWH29_04095 [Methanobrevibacter sp.]|nr:hypothetical protein [Methanobrevibacter sp.]